MRLFGILLIVANLLAGAAFVYFATQNWKGRQTIHAAALRHILLLQGLPFEPPPGAPEGFDPEDETPFVVTMAGGDATKTVSKKLLEAYFAANTAAASAAVGEPTAGPSIPLATNAPVTNQLAEVKRVQKLIKDELAKDTLAPAAKQALLRGWLLYQAENYPMRELLLRLTSPTTDKGQNKTEEQIKADVATLEQILDSRFNAVLNPPQPLAPVPPEGLPDLKQFADALQALRDDFDRLTDELTPIQNEFEKLRGELATLQANQAPDDQQEAKRNQIQAKIDQLRAKQPALQAKQAEIIKKQVEFAEAIQRYEVLQNKAFDDREGLSQDQIERRMRLAHLLIHLDRDGAWQKRVMVIVGLRRYVKAVSAQVLRLSLMTQHVDRVIPIENAVFHRTIIELQQKAIQNAARAQGVAAEKAKLIEQKIVADDAVNRRQTQLKELTDQLNKVKAEVDDMLVRQTAIEQQLFEVQREVALTLEDVYRLEDLLRAMERERYGLPPTK
ncbi:MAG: hypothetical protein RMJ56_06990 [Gemmataceae bacterium]|nr:hypothetical protein [Gemmata sp.]MDW8197335.1 hypothetical protein [Gemmataceae bacterium]